MIEKSIEILRSSQKKIPFSGIFPGVLQANNPNGKHTIKGSSNTRITFFVIAVAHLSHEIEMSIDPVYPYLAKNADMDVPQLSAPELLLKVL